MASPPVGRATTTLCGLEFGYENFSEVEFDRYAPGFFMTLPHCDYAGQVGCKYRPMWCTSLQGAPPYSSAVLTRPITGGSNHCPMNDRLWEEGDALSEAFLRSAVIHLSPRSSHELSSGSDSGEAPPMDNSTSASPWAFHSCES